MNDKSRLGFERLAAQAKTEPPLRLDVANTRTVGTIPSHENRHCRSPLAGTAYTLGKTQRFSGAALLARSTLHKSSRRQMKSLYAPGVKFGGGRSSSGDLRPRQFLYRAPG